MRISREYGNQIKAALRMQGYSIVGFCRVHNISDMQFYRWLSGETSYTQHGIGERFHEITKDLLRGEYND